MNEMRKKRPKEFWKMFKNKKNSCKHNISDDDFYNYFKQLAAETVDIQNEQVQNDLRNFDSDAREATFEELDRPITQSEIQKALNSLASNKACGQDCIINEYFKHTATVLLSPLEKLFNKILSSGEFPSQWSVELLYRFIKRGR